METGDHRLRIESPADSCSVDVLGTSGDGDLATVSYGDTAGVGDSDDGAGAVGAAESLGDGVGDAVGDSVGD